jgi:CheY-like chemotaxis protein
MQPLRLVLVDDDKAVYMQPLTSYLEKTVENLQIAQYETASAFIQAVPGLALNPPNVIVLDLLLPWKRRSEPEENDDANAAKEVPIPLENGTIGTRALAYRRLEGGIVLAEYIREWPTLNKVPIVFLSSVPDMRHLGLDRFKPSWAFAKEFNRDGSPPQPALFIFSLLSLDTELQMRRKTTLESMLDSVELKPGAFGIKVDLKKLTNRRRKRGDA